jgi:hypothetical protein
MFGTFWAQSGRWVARDAVRMCIGIIGSGTHGRRLQPCALVEVLAAVGLVWSIPINQTASLASR